ncbi:MAG: RNA 2',3'-cyclic phosphodiesterase [Ignavibacteria bacterium]|nr:RNA 2',3'-cyclic phosphodiesterase [Ignavibacteria bacterium]
MKNRLFFALNLSEECRKKIFSITEDFKKFNQPVKWEPIEKLHITMLFLGNVEEKKQRKLEVDAEELAMQYSKRTLKFNSVGVFPNERRARVIWVGIEKDEMLTELAESLKTIAKNLKIEIDEKKFHPHVTLGRVKDGLSDEFIKYFQSYKFENFQENVFSLDLMNSKLEPTGSKYFVLSRYNFKEL